jgi:very-short-patch-repair endonuclease
MYGMDRKITIKAETQHGVFTHPQALGAGFTPAMIKQRLHSGRWEALARGVYRVCGSPPTWEQRLIAVVFAAGPLAAASHRSAAALLGIPGFDRRGLVEVTTPRTRRHRPGTAPAVVHGSRAFPDDHLTVVDGIVTTRVARTLVDLAGAVHPLRAERAVDNCLAAGMLTLDALHGTFLEVAERGRKGVAVMRAVLEARKPDFVAPASELEARFDELIRAEGLPEPVRQLDVGDADGWIGRVDYAYLPYGLLIELDGRRHHSALLDRRADARRDARMLAGGWRAVERFTWADLTLRPEAVADRLRVLLGLVAA